MRDQITQEVAVALKERENMTTKGDRLVLNRKDVGDVRIAVEGDRAAASDLVQNTAATGGAVEALHQDVETFTGRSQSAPVTPDVLILDPPRTGLSKAALEGAIRLRARQIIYVSCDVATLARDSRKLLDAGYAIQAVDAFDLFPNTPHVETVVRFEDVRDVRM